MASRTATCGQAGVARPPHDKGGHWSLPTMYPGIVENCTTICLSHQMMKMNRNNGMTRSKDTEQRMKEEVQEEKDSPRRDEGRK